jgi:hypothetical protein
MSAPDSLRSTRWSTIRCSARPAVRTRSIGMISRSIVRIGLIFSAEPTHACAAPIRPPRRRYSSVSTAKRIFSRVRSSRAAASAPARSAPPRTAFAAAIAISPWPAQPVSESTTEIRSAATPSSISASRACSAAPTVPEIPPDRWIESTSSPASSSGCQTPRKSPTDGCDVLGSVAAVRMWS